MQDASWKTWHSLAWNSNVRFSVSWALSHYSWRSCFFTPRWSAGWNVSKTLFSIFTGCSYAVTCTRYPVLGFIYIFCRDVWPVLWSILWATCSIWCFETFIPPWRLFRLSWWIGESTQLEIIRFSGPVLDARAASLVQVHTCASPVWLQNFCAIFRLIDDPGVWLIHQYRTSIKSWHHDQTFYLRAIVETA